MTHSYCTGPEQELGNDGSASQRALGVGGWGVSQQALGSAVGSGRGCLPGGVCPGGGVVYPSMHWAGAVSTPVDTILDTRLWKR